MCRKEIFLFGDEVGLYQYWFRTAYQLYLQRPTQISLTYTWLRAMSMTKQYGAVSWCDWRWTLSSHLFPHIIIKFLWDTVWEVYIVWIMEMSCSLRSVHLSPKVLTNFVKIWHWGMYTYEFCEFHSCMLYSNIIPILYVAQIKLNNLIFFL